MLDLQLKGVTFRDSKSGFAISGLSLDLLRQTHTALVGASGSGKSILLELISGERRPDLGVIQYGARDVTRLRRAKRPVLAWHRESRLVERWSVRHLLVAAARQRSLDFEDRHREIELAAEKWTLKKLMDRSIRNLSSTEQLRAHLAQIELLKPAVFVAERLFSRATASSFRFLADEFYRTLRVTGTTVVSEISSSRELDFCDRIVVMDRGAIVQQGTPKELWDRPSSPESALAIGEANLVPVTIKGVEVSSPIGWWELQAPLFEGAGVAVVRPTDFLIAGPGQDSDLIFGVEEAGFSDGMWDLRGFLTGGTHLHVRIAGSERIHKGRLIPLRFDSSRVPLFAREHSGFEGVPANAIPPIRESR